MHGLRALAASEVPHPAHGLPVKSLFGADIAAATMAEAIALIERVITARGRLHVGVVNAAKLVNMRRQPSLQTAVQACDVIFADGMSVVWASRVLGCPLPERVAGVDLMDAMLARGSRLGWRVYCLGAEPDVLAAAMAVLRTTYPGVQFVGSHHGYFGSNDEHALALEIASRQADILFVGMTSPRKEIFLERWHDVLGVCIGHGVGGSFDILAGKARRAPLLWQRLGLEWLYRVIQEPRRMWRRYLVTNSLFLQMLGAEIVRKIARAPLKGWRRA
jgi:N-acetylglucosaminyldiphosphoundecaprenol N-acetyl-beta-D-mannosaminyltransferase